MKIVQEDLWEPNASVYVVSTNGVIMNNGGSKRLIMGRGAALQMLQHFPDASADFAEAIELHGTQHSSISHNVNVWEYHLVMMHRKRRPDFMPGSCIIGALQTKYDWKRPSPPDLVRDSIRSLATWIEASKHTGIVRMNMPGVGLGGLKGDQVRPMLDCLPDNVLVCWR